MGSTHADDHHPARPRDAAGSACPEEIRLLTRILTGVEAGAPLENLLGEAAADIGRVLAAARVSIVRLHPGRPPELLVPTGRAEPASANAVALATATGGSGAGADAEPRWGLGEDGVLCAPVCSDQEAWGAIVVEPGPRTRTEESGQALEFLGVIGQALGLAVARRGATEHIVSSTAAQIFGGELASARPSSRWSTPPSARSARTRPPATSTRAASTCRSRPSSRPRPIRPARGRWAARSV